MNYEKNQVAQVIASLTENIKRLEVTVKNNFWQKGYVQSCQNTIAAHKSELAKWQAELNA